jgi:uroporphyrinogen decarboxylase
VSQYPIDCVFFGDDWGMQKGLIMGYPLWKRFIRPRIERQYAHVHAKGMYVAQHSCGDCSEVFPDLVAAGLDIYNTFQPEVYDIEFFKKTYGNSITFFGGISTQRLLPYKSPAEVEAECRRILGILSKDGGYILAPTHAAGEDTPPENYLAFLKVCQHQGEEDVT